MARRLVDDPRPVLWATARFVSPYYRAQWEMRHLPDWQRLAVRRAHLSTDPPFLYLHAPKAASSSIKRYLATLLDPAIARYPARGIPGTVSGPQHWRAVLPRLDDPGTLRFSSCLHPVTRALAAFDDLFVRGRHGFSRRHRPHHRKVGLRFGDPSPENFGRFLDYVADAHAESQAFCDPHLRLQSRNLLLDHLPLDRILRVERLREEMHGLARDLGLPPLPDRVFAAEERAGKHQPAFSTPSPAHLRRLHRLYEEDFDRLGYALRR